MANEWIQKKMSGGTRSTALVGGISPSATTFVVTDGSTYPDGSTGKFVVCIDRGTASEEKILITSRTGNTFTVSDRAYDGSGSQSHLAGAVVQHVMDAYSMEQAVAWAAAALANGSMQYRSAAFTYTERAIGSSGLPLIVVAGVPTWQVLDLVGLSAAAVQRMIPAGTVVQTIAASAPSGWLLLDGSTVTNANVNLPFLYAAAPGWQSGSSLILPDARGRAVIGAGTGSGLTNQVLSSLTGAETVALAAGEIPAHTHTVTDGGHSHGPLSPGTAFIVTLAGAAQFAGSLSFGSSRSTTASATNGVTVNNNSPAGSGHANMQPSIALNQIVKAH